MSRAGRLVTALLLAGCTSAPLPSPPPPGPGPVLSPPPTPPVVIVPPPPPSAPEIPQEAPPAVVAPPPAPPPAPPTVVPPLPPLLPPTASVPSDPAPLPDPVAAADRELAARVERALATDPALREAVIEATVERGQVTLTGTVPTFRERARAIEAALRVPGVRSVLPRLVLQTE